MGVNEGIATIRVQVQEGDHLVTRTVVARFDDNGDGALGADEIRAAERRVSEALAGIDGVETVDLSTHIHIVESGTAAPGARHELDLPVGNLVNNNVLKLFGSIDSCAPVGRWNRSHNWAPITADPAHNMPEEVNGTHYCYYQEADRWDSAREMVVPGRIVRVPDRVSPGSTNVHNDIQLWDSGRNEWVPVGTYVVDGVITTPGGQVPMLMYRSPEQLQELARDHAAPRPESDWRFHSVSGGHEYFEAADGSMARVPTGPGGRVEVLASGQAFSSSAVWRPADSMDSVPAAMHVAHLRAGSATHAYALRGPTAGTGANAGYELYTGSLAAATGSTGTKEFRRRAAVPASGGNPEVPAGPLEVNNGTAAAPDWREVRSDGTLGGPVRTPVARPDTRPRGGRGGGAVRRDRNSGAFGL